LPDVKVVSDACEGEHIAGANPTPFRARLTKTPHSLEVGMRICLYLDPSRVFRWHLWLAEALTAVAGFQVCSVFAPASHPLPRSCALLFELERLVYGLAYGLRGGNAIDPAGEVMRGATNTLNEDKEPFGAVIDLAGSGCPLPECERILTPCFNGITGEIGVIAGLVRGQELLVEVRDSACPGEAWTARPAIRDRDILVQGLDNALSCTVRVLVKALTEPALLQSQPFVQRQRYEPDSAHIAGAAMLHATGAIARKMVRLIENYARGGRSWAVAWRSGSPCALLDEQAAAFSIIPDDGCRYYGDPFPLHRDGKTFLFVEEFPYATGRGCISVFEIDKIGRAGTPRIVLEEPYHLSYPFVFEQDGEVWMIPESGEARGVYLYRAEQFPYKWEQEACLISGTEAYDATLLRHNGRFWLSLCEKMWNSSSWDILSLFYSESLTGKWLPHPHNPVLLDATLSRPGGAVFRHKGNTLRPAQDCSRYYGGALSICRVDTLEEKEFSQTLVGRIHCGSYGCHTYNYAGIEVIDVFGSIRGVKGVTAFFAPVP
jgi:hypothetical protein